MINRQAFFNEAANSWDKNFYTPKLIDFLEQIVPAFNLKQGQKILDVGTGTGILIPFLLKTVGSSGHVTAVDYAEKMIEVCKAKYGQVPNVTIMVQQVENILFQSESFDAITCFGLFPHLENKKEALNHMNRVLKPGGRLIIAHALSSSEIKSHHHNASVVVAHDVLPEEAEMKELLKQAGFRKIQITDMPGCYYCLSNKSTLE
jgi:demethylmenaquinone methyltransferase/2-methoxy-6-polyprenyl-1,4-benzoquinol methylase